MLKDHIQESHAGAIIQNRRMPAFKGATSKFAKYGQRDTEKGELQIQAEIKTKSPEFLNKQSKIVLNGCDVYFPFKPYGC